MKAVRQTLFGDCEKCGHRPRFNPARGFISTLVILGFFLGMLAFGRYIDNVIIDGIVERMDARVAQDAKN